MDGDRGKYSEGTEVAGRYVIQRCLGAGAMGSVYEAFDSKVERKVAIKFLGEHLIDNHEIRKRFEREAKAAGRIGHDNVCSVTDWGVSDEGVPFLVMELLDGEPLIDRLRREKVLPLEDAAAIMLQVLAALEAAHDTGIVHRDLKPENIFLARVSQERERVKIVDFGIAKFIEGTATTTEHGAVLGTIYYMSPEQANGDTEATNHLTDIWAAGVILYVMLTGKLPFKRDTMAASLVAIIRVDPPRPTEIDATLPASIDDMVMRALSKDPSERFQSAREFGEALRKSFGYDEAPRYSTIPNAPTQPTPDLAPTEVISPATTSSSEIQVEATVPPVTMAPKRPGSRLKWIVGGVSVTLVILAAILVAVFTSGDDEAQEVSAATEGTEERGGEAGGGEAVATDRAEEEAPAQPAESGDAEAARAEPPAPELITVSLEGLPQGAEVSFDDVLILDNRVKGRPGQFGILEVDAPGYRPLKVSLTLEQDVDLDLSERLERAPTPRTPRPPRTHRPEPATEEGPTGDQPHVVSDYNAE